MAGRLENLAGLFSNVRTRNIIIVTGVVLGLTVTVGLYGLLKSSKGQIQSGANIGQPPKLQSTPTFTQEVTPEQESLVQETNKQMINKAQSTGGSAIDSAIGGAEQNQTGINMGPEKNAEQSDNYSDYINKLLKGESENKAGAPTDNKAVPTNATSAKSNQSDAQQLAELKKSQDQQRALDAQIQAQQLKAEQDALAQISASMENQAKAVLANWTGDKGTPTQVYVEGTESVPPGQPGQPGGESVTVVNGSPSIVGVSGPPPNTPAIIKAGDVLFALLTTTVNSDEPGPVMAMIVSGEYKGSKLVGGLQQMPEIVGTNGAEAVTMTFSTMNIPSMPKSVSINAVAIDAETARTALASDVDHHYIYRYGVTFAASFLQGYGNAITQSGSVQTNATSGATTTFTPTLSPRQEVLAALGQVGTNIASQLNNSLSRPNTITVDAGLSLGILFLADVTIPR